jgi:hypothetical protein
MLLKGFRKTTANIIIILRKSQMGITQSVKIWNEVATLSLTPTKE